MDDTSVIVRLLSRWLWGSAKARGVARRNGERDGRERIIYRSLALVDAVDKVAVAHNQGGRGDCCDVVRCANTEDGREEKRQCNGQGGDRLEVGNLGQTGFSDAWAI